ncbi:hypothetical protein N7513_003432 [Penicillium frequentans]|uniref:Amine oxidase domain-containing protein n=1 Tax=Penicillium frequentans TaxID=3151616 RepID=A0AAD6D015_9EURO|nr:hypothetical protein N7494_005130 [Penicillium glabrum]KAJ5557846.1 hypothetical protein N7513_003432 [Penicillium glabrum]
MATIEPRRKYVAVIGTGMAGLVTAYVLRDDTRRRFEVEVFEKQDKLSLDSASHTLSDQNGRGEKLERLDLPMRAFADGYYEGLKRMYDYFGIEYGSPRFVYSLSALSDTATKQVSPYYIHSSNNHQMPPLRPEGLSRARWLVEVCYLAMCYYWFTACCFFVTPKTAESSGEEEPLRWYLERIRLPGYYVKNYLLPLMSSVTTCSHDALMDFPAIDVVDYERRTFRKKHYTVLGGVHRVQKKLSEDLTYRLGTKVTAVENVGTKVQVSWTDPHDGQSSWELFDHVILGVTPDVVGAIFQPLQSAMAAVPTTTVQSVVHRDFSKILDSSKYLWTHMSLNAGESAPQPIHMRSNATATESIHEHPSFALITTCPIAPIDPEKIVHTARFTRVLRSSSSRQIINHIFNRTQSGDEKSQLWQNGDGNVWLVGGWCWDGMVMLEGCLASAARVAHALDVEVPWTKGNDSSTS